MGKQAELISFIFHTCPSEQSFFILFVFYKIICLIYNAMFSRFVTVRVEMKDFGYNEKTVTVVDLMRVCPVT